MEILEVFFEIRSYILPVIQKNTGYYFIKYYRKELENTEKYRYYVWFGTKDRMRKQKSKKKFGKAINITSNSN